MATSWREDGAVHIVKKYAPCRAVPLQPLATASTSPEVPVSGWRPQYRLPRGQADARAYVRDLALSSIVRGGGGAGEVDVAVSGPDGLNRSVRNPCADVIGVVLIVMPRVERLGR